jgi:WhiB family transcriptional regulator, redox-sensing transcriptional regulator
MRHQSWLPSLPAPQTWQEEASCRDLDPEMFFIEAHTAETRQDKAAAIAVCNACPVAAECLAYALEHDERYGIWGGTSAADRRMMKRGRA